MGVQGDVDAGVSLAAGGSCSLLTEAALNIRMLLRSLSLINPGLCSFRLSQHCLLQAPAPGAGLQGALCLWDAGALGWHPEA